MFNQSVFVTPYNFLDATVLVFLSSILTSHTHAQNESSLDFGFLASKIKLYTLITSKTYSFKDKLIFSRVNSLTGYTRIRTGQDPLC